MINKAAVAGIVFSIVLAGFVGIKVDQTTIALLGGALIGLVVAIPTTALIIVIGMKPSDKREDAPRTSAQEIPGQSQFWQVPPAVTHHHYGNQYIVVVQVPANADAVLARWTVARELRTTPTEAQRMIDAGEVKLLPTAKP